MAKCSVREFANKLDEMVKDSESKKWPLVLDVTGAASTFLRYRDVNYLDMQNPGDAQNPTRIRLAMVGALR